MSKRPRKYWSDLKSKLKSEGSEVSENIGQLKMLSPDGKMRKTDVATTKQLLRLIQSVPSQKQNHSNSGWLKWVKKDLKK
ncbi:hypothetical protein [uncultured Methanobrevibacter sp.]|uniref:hypothetical protein n=1 Tax=uncultured Methanobrevibacter sp. TaxID=253161 RepID=UPI0025CECB59|nr:hypothetical protein [uncultured Methanobrevibacter sp.]